MFNFDQNARCLSFTLIHRGRLLAIEGHEALAARIKGVVESALSRMADHIMRVEVHLADESGPKSRENNKRCIMEARLEGRQPIAVTDEAATVDLAVDGAADKLARLIEHTLGKLHDARNHRTDPPPHKPTFSGQS